MYRRRLLVERENQVRSATDRKGDIQRNPAPMERRQITKVEGLGIAKSVSHIEERHAA